MIKKPTTRDEQFPGSLAFMDVEIKWSHVLLLALSGGSLVENHVKHIAALGGHLTALALRAAL